MAKFNGNYIENPEAYGHAIARRIKANASTSRRRKFEALIAVDGPEFAAWLKYSTPEGIEELGQAAQRAYEAGNYADDAGLEERAAYTKALKEWHAKTGPLPTFLREALEEWGSLTTGQLAFARKLWAERLEKSAARDTAEAARRATATPWIAGRQVIEAEIKSARWKFTDLGYGRSSSALKGLLLLADGRKIWTSLPKSLLDPTVAGAEELKPEALAGKTVKIKTTVEISKDDPTMAFGSRAVAA